MQVVVVLFSIFVQGACGASFGVVPFVSLRAREDLLCHIPTWDSSVSAWPLSHTPTVGYTRLTLLPFCAASAIP